MDAADEWAEQQIDHPVAEPLVAQRRFGRAIVLSEEIDRVGPAQPLALAQDPKLVADRTDRRDDGRQGGPRAPQRIS